MGRSIKLLASSKKVNDSFYAMVAPCMVPTSHPLYSVNNVFNAIFAHGNVLGDVMFYGSGAGKLPTASAVVADVVDAAKHLQRNIMTFWSSKKLELTDIKNANRRFFVRVAGDNGKITELESTFGKVYIVEAGISGEIGFVTEVMTEAEFAAKAEKTAGIINRIRLED